MVSLTTAVDPDNTTTATSAPPGSTTITPYSYATSKIVRTAVAAGIIILVLTGLVLFFKITSWIRTNQRLRRQTYLTTVLQSEQRTNAYEIAAWSDQPGTAPVQHGPDEVIGRGGWKERRKESKRRKEEIKAQKRGGANAFAVKEWEGTAS